MFHSVAFDFSVWELWGALLHGAKVVIVDEICLRSPKDLLALMQREGVTVLCQTPSAFYQLNEAEALMPSRPNLALRYVIFGGEALSSGPVQDWTQRRDLDECQFVNMYGITETTVHVTHGICALEQEASDISSAGRPLPGLRVYVLDPGLQPVANGAIGEIYVSGLQVSRGYLRPVSYTHLTLPTTPYV